MAGPHVDVAAARSAVRAALADLPAGVPVVVACSGGADSLALAAATAFVAARAGRRAGALTVDHGLRTGSRQEAEQAADRCRGLGLEPVEVVSVDVGGHGGPEGAARQARYGALTSAAAAAGAAVLLGHTLDDQAETVLLGLGRGSGARSVQGMPAEFVRSAPDGVPVRFRRPFLQLRRTQTEQVCRALGLEFVVDPTNAADGPWRAADGSALRRAAVREHVVPALVRSLGAGAVPALARTAEQLQRDEDFLQRAAGELLAAARRAAAGGPPAPSDTFPGAAGGSPAPSDTFLSAGEPGTAPEGVTRRGQEREGVSRDVPDPTELDVAALAGAHAALRTRALHAAAREAGCPPGDLTAVHVAGLDALVTGFHGQGPLQLPGGVEAARRCGRLVLERRR